MIPFVRVDVITQLPFSVGHRAGLPTRLSSDARTDDENRLDANGDVVHGVVAALRAWMSGDQPSVGFARLVVHRRVRCDELSARSGPPSASRTRTRWPVPQPSLSPSGALRAVTGTQGSGSCWPGPRSRVREHCPGA